MMSDFELTFNRLIRVSRLVGLQTGVQTVLIDLSAVKSIQVHYLIPGSNPRTQVLDVKCYKSSI